MSGGAQQGSRKGFLSVGEQSTQMAAVAPSSSLEAKGIAELLCLTPQRRLPESRVCVLTDKLLLQGLERDPPLEVFVLFRRVQLDLHRGQAGTARSSWEPHAVQPH